MVDGCGTCGHADFERTPTGRIKRDGVGRCRCPIPNPPPLPESVRDLRWPPHKTGISVGMGEGCPTFSPRDDRKREEERPA